MTEPDRFDWTEDLDALSLTLVMGRSAEEVVALLQLAPLSAEPMTFSEAWDIHEGMVDSDDISQTQISRLDDWLVVIEDNGYLGSLEDNLAALSVGGRAFNVFWNVNMLTRVGYAVDGSVVRAFEPGMDDDDTQPLPEEEGLDFDDEDLDPTALMLTLAERVTGCTLDGAWLMEQARPIYLGKI